MPTLGEIAEAVVATTLVFNSWQIWRAAHETKKIAIVTGKIVEDVTEIKAATNGLTKKLIKATSSIAHAEGVAEGIATTEAKNATTEN